MAVKEQRQLSLFGTKISFSAPPEEEDRVEFAKSSEDGQGSNVEEFSSLSASTSGSDDEKAGLPGSVNDNNGVNHGSAEVLPMTNGIGERRTSRGTLRRPDKPVPCPRCNSLDTKFCYFNNYNVNQPRHFCKNCQRYWTAGGTLRNVPVGAGRRKNKSSRGGSGGGGEVAAVSPSLKAGEVGHQPEPGGLPLEKKVRTFSRSLPRKIDLASPSPSSSPSPCGKEALGRRSVSGTSEASSNDSRDDSTCGSSVSNPGNLGQEARDMMAVQQVGWPVVANGCTGNSSNNNRGGFWQGFVWPAPPVWCPAGWNSAWNTPWGNLAATAASAAAKAIADNVGSLHSALGKHIRDEAENRGPLWAPKTLRIDVQGGEDCRSGSSFLADIGVGNKVESISTGGMFKAFQQPEPEQSSPLASDDKPWDDGPSECQHELHNEAELEKEEPGGTTEEDEKQQTGG